MNDAKQADGPCDLHGPKREADPICVCQGGRGSRGRQPLPDQHRLRHWKPVCRAALGEGGPAVTREEAIERIKDHAERAADAGAAAGDGWTLGFGWWSNTSTVHATGGRLLLHLHFFPISIKHYPLIFMGGSLQPDRRPPEMRRMSDVKTKKESN